MQPDLTRRSGLVELPLIPDQRGNLTFVEGVNHVPFEIKRAYWIYDVPGGAHRGGHAYHQLEELVIALSGSFEVSVDDGVQRSSFTLNRGYVGLYIPATTWRTLTHFSTNAVCLCLASAPYDESDYIRSYPEFLELVAP
ncbi:FdtA/QdtA family cupin domain-containing protein [Solirubrobacter taibaiensis]|nr:FdtA/QdtA family cupin domain-containing protein [Solirubrobacter taibaiensis]